MRVLPPISGLDPELQRQLVEIQKNIQDNGTISGITADAIGRVTLSGGSFTVSQPNITSGTNIFLTGQTTQGRFWIGTRTSSSFVINGNDGGENSSVAWVLFY